MTFQRLKLVARDAILILLGFAVARCSSATPASAAIAAADWAERRLAETGDVSTLWWLAFPSDNPDNATATGLVCNLITRASHDAVVGPVDGVGVVVDVASLARDDADYQEIRTTFLRIARQDVRFHSPPINALFTDANVFLSNNLDLHGKFTADGLVVRNLTYSPPAPWLGEAGPRLQRLTGSPTIPIIDGRLFIAAAMASVEQMGITPRYYDFLGLEPGETSLDEYLRTRGARIDESDRLLAIDQFQVLRREPTGRAGAIGFFQVAGVQPTRGIGVGSITFDQAKETLGDQDEQPYRNLLALDSDAYEVIIQQGNRLEFTLWNSNERLVSDAGDIAHDRTVPVPHDTILFAGKSCVSCHAGESMWRSIDSFVPEDPATLFGVVAEAENNGDPFDIARLRSRYQGRPEDILPRLREDWAANVFRWTGIDDTKAATATVGRVYDEFVYSLVTPEQAFAELGISGWDDLALVADAAVEALRQGRGIDRAAFERVLPLMMGAVR